MGYGVHMAGHGRTNGISHVDTVLEFECDRRRYRIGGTSTNSPMEPDLIPPRASDRI